MQSLCLSRVNFTNLDDTMIQILLLRLCWQLTSCAILKILEYHSKMLPRRNKCREKTPKAAQPVTRPHVIYWRLLVHLPELSIFHRTGQISAIICTNEGIPMLLIKYFLSLFTTSTRRPPTSPISYTTHNWQFYFLYHDEFLQLNSYPTWTSSTPRFSLLLSLLKLELKVDLLVGAVRR